MFSARLKTIVCALYCALFVAGTMLPARAGVFNVKPIRLYLSKDSTSAILTIQNQDTVPLRLQISGLAWSNDRNGQPLLKPTDDLIVFPVLITLNALETRNIRVGFAGTPAAGREGAYRVMLDELPSLESQLSRAHAPGVQVRTRITVPIFFMPPNVVQKAQIDRADIRKGFADATFTNAGNVHVIAQTAKFTGESSTGAKLFSTSVAGWYVLAGESREFRVQIPRSQCAHLKSVNVTVSTDIGSFSRSVPATPDQCV